MVMKSFEIFDFIYETCNGYSNEQKGQLLTVLAEYYLNGVTSFPNVDKEVLGVANTAIKFNTQQSNEKYVSKETLVDWNRQIIGWCKDNNLIKQICRIFFVRQCCRGEVVSGISRAESNDALRKKDTNYIVPSHVETVVFVFSSSSNQCCVTAFDSV